MTSEKKTICPCCKSAVSRRLPIVDLNTNTISFGATTIHLRPTHAELLHVIVGSYPRTASYDHIINRLWGGTEPGDPGTNIKAQLCHLRRVIRMMPFELITVIGAGIRMELNKEIADAA